MAELAALLASFLDVFVVVGEAFVAVALLLAACGYALLWTVRRG